jgi:RND family efflux transporter MFP subunit
MEVKRVRELGDSVSKKRVAEARAAQAVAQKKREGLNRTLKKMLASQSNKVDSPRIVSIKAPISGVIVSSHATLGEFVNPGKRLFEIVDNSHVLIEADVFEMDLALVEDAEKARVISEAYPDRKFFGKLQYIGQNLDPLSRTVKVYFAVANPEGQLREGMFVRVLIETKTREEGVMIPKTAVVNERGQKVVYIKASTLTFVARAIEIKGVWGDSVMVTGIEPGDIVVVQGMYQVRTSAKK